MSLETPNRDVLLLHPAVRAAVDAVLRDCAKAKLPLKVFEAWRSPERQKYLYAQGRTRPGSKVTFAQAWQSYHQYGLAVDLVGYVNGNWTWNLPQATWDKMHVFGAKYGLERLGFETPHLQLAGLKISGLMRGELPSGGDASWHDNLATSAAQWSGTPPAPPIAVVDRPAISAPGNGFENALAAPAQSWHALYGGQEWRFDANGIYLRSAPGTPLRSPGAPLTSQTILANYATDIMAASKTHGIAPELIVMTIATETADARKSNFTGPPTFRWEPGVKVTDVKPATQGDYSAGPMQTLATTARDVIRTLKLPYPDPFKVAPTYAKKPASTPTSNPLYGGALNIDLGTAEIRYRLAKTGQDPILVAAAFNAGGLYQSSGNAWHLRTQGDHMDRAACWYGDACFVLSAFRQGG